MSEVVETRNINDELRVIIRTDEYPENPLDYESMRFMFEHKRYGIGHVKTSDEKSMFDTSNYDSWQDTIDDNLPDGSWYSMVSLYDHSGISLSLGVSSGLDCVVIGFVYMSPKMRKEYNLTDDSLCESYAESSVNNYSGYVSGETYVASIQKKTQLYSANGNKHSIVWEDTEDISQSIIGYDFDELFLYMEEQYDEGV